MKLLVPLLDNNSLQSNISDHFGHAPYFGIYDFEDNSLKIVENKINHDDLQKSAIHQIKELLDIDIIFVKNIGRKAILNAKEVNISLKTGDYHIVQNVLQNFKKLNNQVEDCGHEH